jgi:hypothetical protein
MRSSAGETSSVSFFSSGGEAKPAVKPVSTNALQPMLANKKPSTIAKSVVHIIYPFSQTHAAG